MCVHAHLCVSAKSSFPFALIESGFSKHLISLSVSRVELFFGK